MLTFEGNHNAGNCLPWMPLSTFDTSEVRGPSCIWWNFGYSSSPLSSVCPTFFCSDPLKDHQNLSRLIVRTCLRNDNSCLQSRPIIVLSSWLQHASGHNDHLICSTSNSIDIQWRPSNSIFRNFLKSSTIVWLISWESLTLDISEMVNELQGMNNSNCITSGFTFKAGGDIDMTRFETFQVHCIQIIRKEYAPQYTRTESSDSYTTFSG